jgi:hypothetical protein
MVCCARCEPHAGKRELFKEQRGRWTFDAPGCLPPVIANACSSPLLFY